MLFLRRGGEVATWSNVCGVRKEGRLVSQFFFIQVYLFCCLLLAKLLNDHMLVQT